MASAFRSPPALIGRASCPSSFTSPSSQPIGRRETSGSSPDAIGWKTRLVVRRAWRWRETGSAAAIRLCHTCAGRYRSSPGGFHGSTDPGGPAVSTRADPGPRALEPAARGGGGEFGGGESVVVPSMFSVVTSLWFSGAGTLARCPAPDSQWS